MFNVMAGPDSNAAQTLQTNISHWLQVCTVVALFSRRRFPCEIFKVMNTSKYMRSDSKLLLVGHWPQQKKSVLLVGPPWFKSKCMTPTPALKVYCDPVFSCGCNEPVAMPGWPACEILYNRTCATPEHDISRHSSLLLVDIETESALCYLEHSVLMRPVIPGPTRTAVRSSVG